MSSKGQFALCAWPTHTGNKSEHLITSESKGPPPKRTALEGGNLPIPLSRSLDGIWVLGTQPQTAESYPLSLSCPNLNWISPGLTNVLGYFLKVDHSTVLLWSSSFLATSPNNLTNWNNPWGSFCLPCRPGFCSSDSFLNGTSSRLLSCLNSIYYTDLCKRVSSFIMGAVFSPFSWWVIF